jgi:hypothetical protein
MNHHGVNFSIGNSLRPGFPQGGSDANDEALKKGMEAEPAGFVEKGVEVFTKA